MGPSPLEGIAVKPIISFLCISIIVTIPCSILYAAAVDEQKTTIIVVVGAGGTPEYEAEFAKWADLWEKACIKGDIEYTEIGPRASQSSINQVAETNDRTKLQQLLQDEPKQSNTSMWLVFIGHGTYDGRSAKFNLRGPDVSADDLTEWLGPFSRPIAVINTASSSAPFLNKLSGQGRVIITATKSGFEQNYARFGQYFSGAIIEPEADLDKDGQTSLLEAYLTASNQVDEFYSATGRLATERALLDDNGDGLGTRADWFRGIRPVQKAEGSSSPDGYFAHQFHIIYSEAENNMPLQLRAERDKLELEVIKLRELKENLSEEEYFSRLEGLLYKIAQIYEQADKATQNPR